MRAATGLLVLVVGLLLLLRWNYNSTLEAEMCVKEYLWTPPRPATT